MSNKISNKLLAAFGMEKLDYALFYNWKYSLRFELNSGGSYIEMFTSAYDRFRELLQYTFTYLIFLIKIFRSNYLKIINHLKPVVN